MVKNLFKIVSKLLFAIDGLYIINMNTYLSSNSMSSVQKIRYLSKLIFSALS